MRKGRRLRQLLDERGYTTIELLTVVAILGTILGAITTLFVGATTAELDLNARFQAQQNARVALDRVRRETHCASDITPYGTTFTSEITLTLPTHCSIAVGSVTWCAVSAGGSTTRYTLYRSMASPCGDAGDRVYADYLTTPDVFRHTRQSTASLGTLEVTFPVDLDPSSPGSYGLTDKLVMRNTTRSCVTGSPSPPC